MGKNSSLRETIKKQKNALIYLAVFLVVAVIGVVIILFVGNQEDNTKHNRTDKIVKIGGVSCMPKQNIETYLFMGVDVKGKVTEDMKDNPGQADVLMVLVIDREKNTYAVLPLNRDTITDVDSLDDKNGNYLATTKIQLALAHANGNGQEQSCDNTASAVSNLLHDQYIDGYAALNMDGIKIINHKVGGVPVKIENDFSKTDKTLKKGQTIKLNDDQAYHYVHDRWDVDDEKNESRMKRQDKYMASLKDIVINKTKANKKFPVKLFKSLGDYMVTTLRGSDISKISKAVIKNKYLGKFEIKGKSKIDEYGYNAFYYDQKSLDNVVRTLFYDEVKDETTK